MYYIAFTIGFFGSLHCIGMCGPLALMVNRLESSRSLMMWRAVEYNIGRVLSYTLLGLLFGTISSLIIVEQFQKFSSILLGIVFVLIFIVHCFKEAKSLKNQLLIKAQSLINRLYLLLSRLIKNQRPIYTGAVNGLLPCGLVYVALAGSISMASIPSSMLFMAFFGLGTAPALLFLVMGFSFNRFKAKFSLTRLTKFVYLFFGLFLIYRGVEVDMPLALDFYEAIKNPILCH